MAFSGTVRAGILLAATMVGCPIVWAQGAASADPLATTPAVLRLTTESVRLPGRETLGLLGGQALFDVSDHLRLGVGSYGAVRGERGGFITLGAAAEVHRPLGDGWSARAGLFAGAGGGRGGYVLSGGGLMLRGDVGIVRELGGLGNLGLGVSHVSFPSGAIRSTQLFAQVDYPFHVLMRPGWPDLRTLPPEPAAGVGLGAHTQEVAPVFRAYRMPASVTRDDGSPQPSRLQVVGIEWLSYLDERWFLKLESEGALGGQNNGYMQILAGGGHRFALSERQSLKAYATMGPAGGGGVDTGGGLLIDTGLAWQTLIGRHGFLELGWSELRAPSRSFRAHSVDLKVGYRFDTPTVSASPMAAADLAGIQPEALRARWAYQRYTPASATWRNRSVDAAVGNLGVQLDYFVRPDVFLTGQGLAAAQGNAGAYMTGLIGAGMRRDLSEAWFVEAEALVGAAGGGGLSVGGGLVAQGNASLGYRLSESTSILSSVGRIQSASGGFKANVAGLAIAYQFTGYRKP